ncbi:MAG: ribonuclease P protein component 1 [Natronomonas sp.]
MIPETLPRHELAGLSVGVVESSNRDLVGLTGRVRDETTNTLIVATESGIKQVPKAGSTFRFELTADDSETVRVRIEGERLVARPARRTETRGGSLWQ